MTGRPSETELRNNRGECRLDRFHLAQIRHENSQANYVLIYSGSSPMASLAYTVTQITGKLQLVGMIC